MLKCNICDDFFNHLTLDLDKNNIDILVCDFCIKKLNKKIKHRKYVENIKIKEKIKKIKLS